MHACMDIPLLQTHLCHNHDHVHTLWIWDAQHRRWLHVCMHVCMYVYIYVCMNMGRTVSSVSACMYVCITSDRFRRFVFQRCRLQLVVNVKKEHTRCKYATLYGNKTVARWAISLHTPVTAEHRKAVSTVLTVSRSKNGLMWCMHEPSLNSFHCSRLHIHCIHMMAHAYITSYIHTLKEPSEVFHTRPHRTIMYMHACMHTYIIHTHECAYACMSVFFVCVFTASQIFNIMKCSIICKRAHTYSHIWVWMLFSWVHASMFG